MLTVACYLWGDPAGESPYSAADVHLLKRMVDRHLTVPHEFVCITDRPGQFDGSEVRAVKLPQMPIEHGMYGCQKLLTFHPIAATFIGERILAIDLDVVIVANFDSIVDRPEDLVLWRNPSRRPWNDPKSRRAYYNSSLVLLRAGSWPEIWNRYAEGKAKGYPGDQDWISKVYGPLCHYWDDSSGVYRLARTDTPGSGVRAVLPGNAKIVFFPGDEGKPWIPAIAQECPWIAEHRR